MASIDVQLNIAPRILHHCGQDPDKIYTLEELRMADRVASGYFDVPDLPLDKDDVLLAIGLLTNARLSVYDRLVSVLEWVDADPGEGREGGWRLTDEGRKLTTHVDELSAGRYVRR